VLVGDHRASACRTIAHSVDATARTRYSLRRDNRTVLADVNPVAQLFMPSAANSTISARIDRSNLSPTRAHFQLAALAVREDDLHDGTQLAEREPAKVFNDLAETPGVEITIKRKSSDLMHLKSYQIDGRLLRTGAANFSASGLKRQDNDLIVIESPGAAASFKRNFEARYASGG
jgi:phosphatidylserine/phosphatidylglycerophosphate/cardiolipin synthase-like enzyme